MAMTRTEFAAKGQIMHNLAAEGYPTYAKLLSLFDIHLTADPDVIGYMIPNKAVITLNQDLDIDQVSTVVRHEILHEYLTHQQRMEAKVGVDVWANRTPAQHKKSNIAGDYEISNLGYTEKDKNIIRNIIINGNLLRGLVTEDDHPDWVNLSFEEMYDLLQQESENDDNQQQSGDNQPQIGDTGNSEIQKAEDENRKNNAYSDDDGNILQPSSMDGNQESASDDNSDPSGKTASKSDRQTAIKKAFSDIVSDPEFKKETENPLNKEAERKAAREIQKYKSSSLIRFKDSLNKFIRDQIEVGKEKTWKRINKNTVASGIVRKGTSRLGLNKIPLINVYFDNSGSWDEEKIKVGKDAISTLNKYVQRHEITIKLYYFSDDIHITPAGEGWRAGGTKGQPILDHINATKPNNVIIMTDSDIGDCTSDVTVDGGVWLLFKDGMSNNLIQHIHGKKLTKIFEI